MGRLSVCCSRIWCGVELSRLVLCMILVMFCVLLLIIIVSW